MNVSTWEDDIIHRPLRILTVGDGNLSFTASLLKHHYYVTRKRRHPTYRYIIHRIPLCLWGSVYDSESTQRRKYRDGWVQIENIQQRGGLVLYNIDACNIKESLYNELLRLKHKHKHAHEDNHNAVTINNHHDHDHDN